MDSISSKIETLFSSFMDLEGHLPAAYDLNFDAFVKSLFEVRGQKTCSAQTALAILQGLQRVQQISAEAKSLAAQQFESHWSFAIFGSPGVSTTLSLTREGAEQAGLYFQLDSSGQVCGSFTVTIENEREDHIYAYSFEQHEDGYYLAQSGEGNPACRIEMPAGEVLPWKHASRYEFLDDLLPSGEQGIGQWIHSILSSEKDTDQTAPSASLEPRVCHACGAALEVSMRFCGQCGAPVKPAPTRS
jgi:hypothetical protein